MSTFTLNCLFLYADDAHAAGRVEYHPDGSSYGHRVPEKQEKLKVLVVSSELAPFAKTGGLADVSAALSRYLHDDGHDVRVLMPEYSRITDGNYDVRKVDRLQDLVVDIGPWNISYSIDSVGVPGSDMRIYLLRCPELYGRDSIYTNDDDEHLRFVLLSRAAIELCQHQQFAPDIFSCHDWQTALVPLYLRTIYAWDKLFARTRSVLTIHNIGYQGVFSSAVLNDLHLGDDSGKLHQDDLRGGVINFLKTGVLYADMLTTVSPTYAHEIQTAEYGAGLDPLLRERRDRLIGILNGVDYDEWNPATDALIPYNFSAADLRGKSRCKSALEDELGIKGGADIPLIGIVSRLVGQKGFDLVETVVPSMLSQHMFSVAVLGSGERRFEDFFRRLQRAFPGRVCFYNGYNNRLAHWIEAGSDMFLMPSLYEPCGLNQMYSLKYGTIPIVRETGGLADSVQQIDPSDGTGTGILFRDYNQDGLRWALGTALTLYSNQRFWQKIIQNAMAMDFSWEQQGRYYVSLFRQLVKLR